MPLYEYLCATCGLRSEILQRLADPPASICPECGGALRKLVSAPAFQFKGSGWYLTDYAKKSESGEGKGESAKGDGTKGDGAKTAESGAGGGSAGGSGGGDAGAPAAAAPAPAATAAAKPAKAAE